MCVLTVLATGIRIFPVHWSNWHTLGACIFPLHPVGEGPAPVNGYFDNSLRKVALVLISLTCL
jgi:hypothetical protein